MCKNYMAQIRYDISLSEELVDKVKGQIKDNGNKVTFSALIQNLLLSWSADAMKLAEKMKIIDNFTEAEFIEKCNNSPEFSAIILDESFADLNSCL